MQATCRVALKIIVKIIILIFDIKRLKTWLKNIANYAKAGSNDAICSLKLGLHHAICLTDSSEFTLGHHVNFEAMRYEWTSLNRIVGDKSCCVTLALHGVTCLTDSSEFTLGHYVNFEAI